MPGAAWWGSLVVGLLACAILLANNVRDVPTDTVAGKRTLAVRVGVPTARRFLEARCPPDVPRSYLEAPEEELPPFWDELAAQGWLALAVDEAYGGQGYGLVELAVVLEELGRAMAPGPFPPSGRNARCNCGRPRRP